MNYATPLQKFLDKDQKAENEERNDEDDSESDNLPSTAEAAENAVEPSADKAVSGRHHFKVSPFAASGGKLGKLGRFVPMRMRGNY